MSKKVLKNDMQISMVEMKLTIILFYWKHLWVRPHQNSAQNNHKGLTTRHLSQQLQPAHLSTVL